MRKLLSFIFLWGVSFSFYSQAIIDTIFTPKGKVIIYANKTWEYLVDKQFDGILNQELHNFISSDSSLNYIQDWDNNVCFTSDRTNDLGKLKDTIWLCVNNELYSQFCIPNKGYITSRYGMRKGKYHNGIDIGLKVGDTVRAAWSGKVRYAKFNDGGFGNLVIIRHYNGLETFYAHLSKHMCVVNQEVNAGDVIGLGGNTGHSFGPHLHFEIRFYDAPMNPEEIIDFEKRVCKDENLMVHKELFRPGAKPSDFNENGESPSATLPPEVVVKKVVKPIQKYHKVKSGDTLSAIATKHNTTIATICKLNGIRQNSSLQIGRNLRVK